MTKWSIIESNKASSIFMYNKYIFFFNNKSSHSMIKLVLHKV